MEHYHCTGNGENVKVVRVNELVPGDCFINHDNGLLTICILISTKRVYWSYYEIKFLLNSKIHNRHWYHDTFIDIFEREE